MKTMKKIQQGFSLISAIFLLVVIAALGTFAVTLSTTQQQSAALDVMGARAYQAARAGMEWGAYQLLRGGTTCANTNATLPANALPNTLSGFTVTVACTTSLHTDAGVPINVYNLTSTAKTSGATTSPNYVERQVSATFAK